MMRWRLPKCRARTKWTRNNRTHHETKLQCPAHTNCTTTFVNEFGGGLSNSPSTQQRMHEQARPWTCGAGTQRPILHPSHIMFSKLEAHAHHNRINYPIKGFVGSLVTIQNTTNEDNCWTLPPKPQWWKHEWPDRSNLFRWWELRYQWVRISKVTTMLSIP